MMERRQFLQGSAASLAAIALPFSGIAAPQKLGVTLFGASWCPFCHKAAQLLVSLRDAGQIDLIVISLDAGPIGVVADPVPDTGQAEAIGVRGVPVTVVFDPKTGDPAHFIRGFKGYRPFLNEMRSVAALLMKGTHDG